jgi:hypothetical protein
MPVIDGKKKNGIRPECPVSAFGVGHFRAGEDGLTAGVLDKRAEGGRKC